MPMNTRRNRTKKVRWEDAPEQQPTPSRARRNRKATTPRRRKELTPPVDEDPPEDVHHNEDDESSSSEEEAAAPIHTRLEIKRVFDNVKHPANGAIQSMTAWSQPGNNIDDDKLSEELDSIEVANESWALRWLEQNRDKYSAYTIQDPRAEVIGHGDFTTDLHEEWTCHDKHCTNWGKCCWKTEEGDHIRLVADDLARWSEQVSAGKTTLQEIPEGLLHTLLYRRLKQVTEAAERKKKKKVADTSTSTSLPIHINLNGIGGVRNSIPLADPPHNAAVGLNEAGSTFNILRKVSAADWNEMGVKKGVQIQLLDNQKVWQADLMQKELLKHRQQRAQTVSSDEVEEGV
ncbi:hypothetical protein OHC33_011102 [Knufia fluminis]|uniref:Uncharacterized protein n=1 Tax=Knufia fluminis TaxID=191047 RepID=A0AAN8EIH7_9EURO|nr:hypothetical protein OHC33_011102 [Knufia fluminis]